jgi:hypothetical protein
LIKIAAQAFITAEVDLMARNVFSDGRSSWDIGFAHGIENEFFRSGLVAR